MANYWIAQLDEATGQPCPCGTARRAFRIPENRWASVHLVDIHADARTHYHRTLTEVYVVLEGEGWIELDGEEVAVRPLTAILIRPGCRHRARGRLKVLNFVLPPFDPADEWFD